MSTHRRGTGEGSIYKRADGRWAGSVTVGYGPRVRYTHADGGPAVSTTRRRATVYGATRKEVEAKLQALRRAKDTGLPVVDQRTTVATYLNDWLERSGPRLRAATLLRYRGLVRHQLAPHLGHLKLAKLSQFDIERMMAALAAQGLSPRTVHHARAVLRTALSDAERHDLVQRNVAKLSAAPKVDGPSPKLLPLGEVLAVIEAVRGTDVENVVIAGLYSGMRIGELLGLRWADIAFDAGQVTVSSALQRLNRETRLVEPKSERSHRTLQLPRPALDALRAEQGRQAARHLAAECWRPLIPDLVFTDAKGQPLVPTTVTAQFRKALSGARLTPLRFHHLRHLHAGLMLASGTDIAVVSHLLGHSSVALTVSTYAGVMPSLKREAAERFEQLLSRQG